MVVSHQVKERNTSCPQGLLEFPRETHGVRANKDQRCFTGRHLSDCRDHFLVHSRLMSIKTQLACISWRGALLFHIGCATFWGPMLFFSIRAPSLHNTLSLIKSHVLFYFYTNPVGKAWLSSLYLWENWVSRAFNELPKVAKAGFKFWASNSKPKVVFILNCSLIDLLQDRDHMFFIVQHLNTYYFSKLIHFPEIILLSWQSAVFLNGRAGFELYLACL